LRDEKIMGTELLWIGAVLAGLIGCFVLLVIARVYGVYKKYVVSPEKQWRDCVFQLIAQVEEQEQREEALASRLGGFDCAQEETLRNEAFTVCLQKISTQTLDVYPGIGPATVDRLRKAGYKNVAAMRGVKLHISGLGEKRLHDIESAVRDVIKQEWSRFLAGGCPEAVQFREHLQALRANTSEDAFRCQARLTALRKLRTDLAPLEQKAKGLAFWDFILMRAKKIATPHFIREPLPDWHALTERADEAARRRYPTRTEQAEPAHIEEKVLTSEGSQYRIVFAKAAPPVAQSPAKTDLFREALQTAKPSDASRPVAFVPPKKKSIAKQVLPATTQAKPAPQPPAATKPAPPVAKSVMPSRSELLAVLEIDPALALAADLVRRQYNLLSERYAPEKFTAAGAEFVAVAQKKRAAVLAAATELLHGFGEAVDVAPAAAPAKEELRHNPDLDAMFGV
jgi:hypothetical protein